MKSQFYVYNSPEWDAVSERYHNVNLKNIYFEDRDDVYDFLYEPICQGIIAEYPTKIHLLISRKDRTHSIVIPGSYLILDGVSNCSRKLIASLGGESM